jgi:hypothetical protein
MGYRPIGKFWVIIWEGFGRNCCDLVYVSKPAFAFSAKDKL